MFLADYLDEVLERPWQWGEMDCCFFAGNWIRDATGRDPLAPYRGLYRSALNASRLILERGGLIRMVDIEMERCGFSRTGNPRHGDIGLVPMVISPDYGVARASLIIMNEPWWVGRTISGIAGFQCEAEAAWRVL